MSPLRETIPAAVRSCVEAQTVLFNELAKSMSHSFRQGLGLNLQLMQTLLEETLLVSGRIATAERPTEILNAFAIRAQAVAEAMRLYQENFARVTADAQVDMSRVSEQYLPETALTARALADEVQLLVSVEQAEETMHQQQEVIRQFSDALVHIDSSVRPGQEKLAENSADAVARAPSPA